MYICFKDNMTELAILEGKFIFEKYYSSIHGFPSTPTTTNDKLVIQSLQCDESVNLLNSII